MPDAKEPTADSKLQDELVDVSGNIIFAQFFTAAGLIIGPRRTQPINVLCFLPSRDLAFIGAVA